MAQTVKNIPQIFPRFDPWVEKLSMATHSSILAWRISWTDKPGRLQSMGSQRVIHRGIAFSYMNVDFSCMNEPFKREGNAEIPAPKVKESKEVIFKIKMKIC